MNPSFTPFPFRWFAALAALAAAAAKAQKAGRIGQRFEALLALHEAELELGKAASGKAGNGGGT